MDFLIVLFIFVFGTIIGSFLNVVILRYDTGRSVGGRSSCSSCSKTLTWTELFPLFSFLIQLAKCRSCKAPLSWQYPLVEFLTGVLFVLVHLKFAEQFFTIGYLSNVIFYFVVISLLMVITVYDFYHKIIPNPFVYTLIILTGIKLFVTFTPFTFIIPTVWEILAGPILFAPFAFLWWISKGTWMGFGDAKLAIAIGFMLGLQIGISAIIIAFWIGAVYGIGILTFQYFSKNENEQQKEKMTMKSEVPFGPFLIIGTLLGFFLALDVLSLNYLLLGL